MSVNEINPNSAVTAPLSIAAVSSYLDTVTIGSTLAVTRVADSTNNYIKNRAEILDDGFTILTETQLSGRGRLGKKFISPEGGLYMSILLVDNRVGENAEYITVRAALAVLNALRELTHLDGLGIKWVNDIYCHDRKICGILAERVTKKGYFDYTVLGIGINVTTNPADFGDELSDVAGAISDFTTVDFSKNRLAAAILNNLEKYLLATGKQAHARMIEEYRSQSILIGRDVYVIKGAENVRAAVIGIDDDASLYVRYGNGTTGILRTGEVSTKLVREGET